MTAASRASMGGSSVVVPSLLIARIVPTAPPRDPDRVFPCIPGRVGADLTADPPSPLPGPPCPPGSRCRRGATLESRRAAVDPALDRDGLPGVEAVEERRRISRNREQPPVLRAHEPFLHR